MEGVLGEAGAGTDGDRLSACTSEARSRLAAASNGYVLLRYGRRPCYDVVLMEAE